MKLVNAKLYEEEIRTKLYEVWYDEKYQYYFCDSTRRDFVLDNNSDRYITRAFAVLGNSDELIGLISYCVDIEMEVVQCFGAINFSDDKFTFGKAIYQTIYDCFVKYKINVLEWNVVCGNPIERNYDRLCKKFGGRVIGIRKRRYRALTGEVHDDKSYEILREDFLKSIKYKG